MAAFPKHKRNTASEPADVPATSVSMYQPAQVESAPRMHELRNLRMPEPWQVIARVAPSQNTQDRLQFKAKLAIPHILMLLAGLAYLITTFMVVSIGFCGISGTLSTRLEDASVELRAQGSLKFREDILESQLDKLLRTQLNSKFMETYEECLARGILQGNSRLFGLGFQYSTFRDQTIDWTIENCGRLHHAPQIIQTSPHQDSLTGWARISYRVRRLAKKTIILVTRAAKPLQIWLFNKTGAGFLKQAEPIMPAACQPLACAALPARKLMPAGFDLHGNTSFCRLVYVRTDGTSTDKATMSEEALTESKRKVQKLFRVHHHADGLCRATATIAGWLVPLELLCFMIYVLSKYSSGYAVSPSTTDRRDTVSFTVLLSHLLTKQEQCATVCIIAQLTARIASTFMEQASPLGRLTIMDLGVFMITCSLSMMVQAFIPVADIADVPQMYKAIKQIYRIAKQPDVPAFQAMTPQSCIKGNGNIGEDTNIMGQLGQDHAPSHTTTSSASSSHTNAPITSGSAFHARTLEEEFRNETQSMDRSYNARTKSETDSDSDGEDYVDLTNGVTPTIGDDSDWSVVDA